MHRGADCDDVVEGEHERAGVLARVEPSPDGPPPAAESARLAVRPGPRPPEQAHRDEAAVTVLERDVVHVADHLLLAPEDLVVEEAQSKGQWGAGSDRPAGGRVAGHCPAPVRIMRGIAAADATTTTTR